MIIENINLQELAKDLLKNPVSIILLFFSGIFVISSIISGKFIELSFMTLFYSVTASFLRLLRKDEHISSRTYHILNFILLGIWGLGLFQLIVR